MPARSVLMVQPIGFGPNAMTGDDNAFQTTEGFEPLAAQAAACEEFDALVKALQEAGVEVHAFQGREETPDAVFPNNWFSTHEEGRLVLYPMRAESRRLERDSEAADWLKTRYPHVTDISSREMRGEYLESTGSLVLDRRNKIAYAAVSGRTTERALKFWAAHVGYEPVMFETIDRGGIPVYHTNVLMSIGENWAVLCSECIVRPAPIISGLLATRHEIIEITRAQMGAFCGNVIELENGGGAFVIAMSQSAHDAFTSDQLRRLGEHGRIVAVPIPTIERFGGGSVRCMIAELF